MYIHAISNTILFLLEHMGKKTGSCLQNSNHTVFSYFDNKVLNYIFVSQKYSQ